MDPIAKALYDNIFLKPSDPEHTVLWRYLSTDPDDATRGSVDKFASLIKSNSLWLTKASKLPDKLEVRSTDVTRRDLRGIIERANDYYDEQEELQIDEGMPALFFVNCWHRNDSEANWMWRDYCGTKQGIVVRTTFAKLEAACNILGEENIIGCGCIEYNDRSNLIFPHGNPFYECMSKDLGFSQENEIRIATLRVIPDDHVDMPVDLGELIDGVFVHRLASEDYYSSVESLLKNHLPALLNRLEWSSLKRSTSATD